ncbi:MAG: putative Ig domain-containing protein, partial [Proteobacteria bacterium]|nr:putative Ig domain-containing protein [Pseudomonadota bacterium]
MSTNYNRNALEAPALSLVVATSASQPTTHLAAMGLALMVAATLVLAACGGGSTPAATTPTPTPTLTAPTLADLGGQMLTKDTATNLVFANTGGAPNANDATPVGCTASDNLPAGLTVGLSANKLSCAITGAPSTVNATAVTVTVTATNATGTDNATVSITVADSTTPLVAPVLANLGTLELTKGTAVSNLVFVNSGGAPNAAGASTAGCTASEELPAGLVVGLSTNTLSCAITGTPNTANATAVTVTVTATNATGSDDATVTLTVADTPAPLVAPVLADLGARILTIDTDADLAFANTG